MEFDTFRISTIDDSAQARAQAVADAAKIRPSPAKPLVSSIPHKLEPFLLLAKNAKGASAKKLVEDVTAAEGVYVFRELLDVPGIKELSTSSDGARHHALLELFAYGTWSDYEAARDSLPALNESQVFKLKQLSLVSLAMKSRRLAYSDVISSLSLPSALALELLVTQSIYSNLITARLDQRSQVVEVDWSDARDILVLPPPVPEDMAVDHEVKASARFVESAVTVTSLRNTIQAWKRTVQEALDKTDRDIGIARQEEELRRRADAEQNQLVERAVADFARNLDHRAAAHFSGSGGGGGRGSFDDYNQTEGASSPPSTRTAEKQSQWGSATREPTDRLAYMRAKKRPRP